MNYPVYTSMPYPVQQQQMQQRADMQNQQLMQQQIMQQQAQQPVLSPASRVVVSREEAIATPADFSGALMIFPDITNNCVYIKHWNAQTGAAEFMDYFPPMPIAPQAQEQQPQQNQGPPAFASLQALADLQSTVDDLEQQVELLKKLADKPNGKAEKKNDAK